MTIKNIVDNIAQHFGKPFDNPFKSRIKSEVLAARAEIIKQHYNKYYSYPESLVSQIHRLKMVTTDIAENDIVNLGVNVSKTNLEIPTPIRMSIQNSNFIYVGTLDGNRSFGWISPENFEDLKYDRFLKDTIRYTYINRHIYILGDNPKNIRIRGIFADPYQVAELNGEVEEEEPQTLDIPEDFVNLIERMVIDMIQRGFVRPDSEEEIKIEERND